MQRTTNTTWTDGKKVYGLDLETACNVQGCTGFGGSDKCNHALDFNRNQITVAAISDGAADERVFRGTDSQIVKRLEEFVSANPDVCFTAHMGKFDFKILSARSGYPWLDLWKHDSCLLAFTHQAKIPDSWLEEYEGFRRDINAKRTGHKHRNAGKHSLKTCAPFYLHVDAFWEPEHGHDDDAYVTKDARYALMLTEYFLQNMPEKSLEFYHSKQLPWAKMLTQMELRGVRLDEAKMADMWRKSEANMFKADDKIRAQWSEHFNAYVELQDWEIREKHHARALVNASKGRTSEKQKALQERNLAKALDKIEPLNLDSPKQLLWLIRDRLGLDATNLDGDVSTDAETLTRLSGQNQDVATLLEYRHNKKLCSTYFPAYKELAVRGRVHATFNPATARTGRLTCSDPNLQQVPGELHELLIADEGYKFITRDLSAIEPTVLAYYSEDPVLCDILISGSDFHGTTAVAAFDLDCHPKEVKKLFPQVRNIAKTIGLAVLYGAGANRVYATLLEAGLSQMTLTDARRIVQKIRTQYKGVWDFKTALDKELEAGAMIYNLLGRPFSIAKKEDVYMKGLNTLIQSSASDVMLDGAYHIVADGIATPMLLVHDELICQAPIVGIEAVETKVIQYLQRQELKTAHGLIPVRTEGKINNFWEK